MNLKIYTEDYTELKKLLHTVQTFIDEIGMEFGHEKLVPKQHSNMEDDESTGIVLNDNTVIKELDQESTYKYPGVNENNGIQHSTMKEHIWKECIHRARTIMKTEVNFRNRINAIDALEIPVVTYSCNVVNLDLMELKNVVECLLRNQTSAVYTYLAVKEAGE